MATLESSRIEHEIAKGLIKPDYILTNMAMAYVQETANRPASFLAPIIPVPVSTGTYYIFNKEDLLRDNFRLKPQYGAVDPAVVSRSTGTYQCTVEQLMFAEDEISRTNDTRRNVPEIVRTPQMVALSIAQQHAIHLDRMFANRFFNKTVWGENVWTGKDGTASEGSQEFLKFTDANSNPIKFFRKRIRDIQEKTGRKPNKLGLGVDTYEALLEHPVILSRITGNGSAQNPAQADLNVLATLFGVDKVGVFDSISNEADIAKDADMKFICDRKGALLAYTPDAPSMQEPSAAYTFAWDMLGNGQHMVINKGEGGFGEHVSKTECLIAPDMRITCQDLGVFMTDCA